MAKKTVKRVAQGAVRGAVTAAAGLVVVGSLVLIHRSGAVQHIGMVTKQGGKFVLESGKAAAGGAVGVAKSAGKTVRDATTRRSRAAAGVVAEDPGVRPSPPYVAPWSGSAAKAKAKAMGAKPRRAPVFPGPRVPNPVKR